MLALRRVQIQVPIRVIAVDGMNSAMSGAEMSVLVQAKVVGTSVPGTDAVVYGQILSSGEHADALFTALTLEGPPGADVYVAFTSLNPNHLKPAIATFHISNCVVGEVLIQQQCVPCEEGWYSWNPHATTCDQCPANAVCPGGNIVIAQSSYWRPNKNYTQMIKCHNPQACLGAQPYSRDPPDVEGCLHGCVLQCSVRQLAMMCIPRLR